MTASGYIGVDAAFTRKADGQPLTGGPAIAR